MREVNEPYRIASTTPENCQFYTDVRGTTTVIIWTIPKEQSSDEVTKLTKIIPIHLYHTRDLSIYTDVRGTTTVITWIIPKEQLSGEVTKVTKTKSEALECRLWRR